VRPSQVANDPEPTALKAAQSAWSGDGEAWYVTVSGDWQGQHAAIADAPQALTRQAQASLKFDARDLATWDAGLPSALWRSLSALDPARVHIDTGGLPTGLAQILSLALPKGSAGAAVIAAPLNAWARWGLKAQAVGTRLQVTLGFVGSVLMSLSRLVRGRSDMRLSDLAWQVEHTGPRSLPIVALVSFLVGLIVAYMSAAQLERFGAQSFIADLVTVGVVREIAALLVGIVLAGRVGAAFAAQIGSMRANDEVDALQTMGVDPVDHLVLPRVLALLIVGPLLTVFAALVGMLVGWAVAVLLYGVTPLEYAYKSVQALTLPHVLIGLLKGTVYALLVALAGCRQGLAAGRSAQAVGDATTAAVVQAIVWIVVAASVLTVIFQRLDW